MVNPHGDRPGNGENVGAVIATEMLKNLVILNEQIAKSHELYQNLQETVDDLVGYHETYMRAVEILIEKSDDGKNKFSMSDIIRAMAEAAEEVLGDAGDEPGPEDPLVGSGR